MFKLHFKTGNAAFADGNAYAESADILRTVAQAIERGTRGAPIHDSNGNCIVRFDLTIAADA